MRIFLLFALLAGSAGAQDLCSDYLSRRNCIGKPRPMHHGIDFGGPAGSEALSATWGTVVRRTFDECSGPGLAVRTDFIARHDEIEGPVYIRYAHIEPNEDMQPGRKLRPGEPIGTLIPLRHTRCHGSRTHVHYELRVLNSKKRHIDPHAFWADGPGKVTCYAEGMAVPPNKAVAPRPCSR